MAFEAVEGGEKRGPGEGAGGMGSGVVVGLAGSWRCSRWCPGRRGASIARPQHGPARGSGRVVAVVVGCSG